MLFNELKEILRQEHVETCDVSEIYGIVCGILIAASSFFFENWMNEMVCLDYFATGQIGTDNLLKLKTFFIETATQSKEGDLNFQLLLPDDECTKLPLGRHSATTTRPFPRRVSVPPTRHSRVGGHRTA